MILGHRVSNLDFGALPPARFPTRLRRFLKLTLLHGPNGPWPRKASRKTPHEPPAEMTPESWTEGNGLGINNTTNSGPFVALCLAVQRLLEAEWQVATVDRWLVGAPSCDFVGFLS